MRANRASGISAGTAGNAGRVRTARNAVYRELSRNRTLFLMLLPAVIYVFVFSYVPMGGIIVAFKNYQYNLGILSSPWVGFENFEYFFRSGKAWLLTKNTFLYNSGFMLVNILLEVLFAILFSELVGARAKKLLQSLMILPHFISWVVVGGFVFNIFNFEYGLLNTVLDSLGLARVNVYQKPELWRGIITMACAWKIVGYGMIVYLAAIMGISPELYESAYLDGAGIVRRIRHITLPMLLPTVAIMFLLKLGSILKGNFEMFYQLVGNNGQLFDATDVIDTFVFRSLTMTKDIGMAAAAGFYQQLIGCAIVVSANALIRRVNPDYALF